MRNFLGPDAVLGTDKKGDHYALYFDDADGRGAYTKPVYTGPMLAPITVRDAVYRLVLDTTWLEESWRIDLRRRGLTDDQIEAEGYRSFGAGDGKGIVFAAMKHYTPAQLAEVPGFVVTDRNVRFLAVEGLWIPVRDAHGLIQAIKVRRTAAHVERTGQKYTYLTSTSEGGVGPSSPAHAPVLGRPGMRIRMTEGELKAAVCCAKSSTYTISVPGATQTAPGLDMLPEFECSEVVFAWDADVTRDYGIGAHGQKRNYVASGLEHAAHVARERGFRVAVEWWPADAGKGLDDVLAAGLGDRVVCFEGQAAWDRILDNLTVSKSLARKDTVALASEAAQARYRAANAPAATVAPETEPAEELPPLTGDAAGLSGLDAALAAAEAPPKALAAKPPSAKPARKKKEPYSGPPADFERGDEVELAETLMVDLREDSPEPVLTDRDEFWRFEPETGLWAQIPADYAYKRVAGYAGRTVPTDKGPAVLKLGARSIKGTLDVAKHLGLQNARAFEASGMFFDKAPVGIATRDKFVRVTPEGEVIAEPLCAAHRQTVCLDFDWDETATAPKWQAFYDSIFANCDALEAQRRQDALDEFVGASLFGVATRYQQCFLLSGSGSNGKGTWSKVIERLFPEEFVCAMTPEDLGSSRFALENIVGKRLNIVGEIPNKMLEGTDKLKALIAGDKMSAEPKGKRRYNFIPFAGHAWGVNEVPPTRDQSHGFYRRWVIVPFEMKFDGSTGRRVDYHVELSEELPGIFARCVKSLVRLVKRGEYETPGGSKDAVERWKDLSDQVRVFVGDCCVPDKTAETSLSAIYAAYEYWARQNGHTPMASNNLGNRLNTLGHYHRDAHLRCYRLFIRERGAAASMRQPVPAAHH